MTEEKTPLRQAWSDYLASGEYQQASQADFSAAMFQSFAYAFAAGSLRSSAQVREAEARWEALRLYHVEKSERAMILNERAFSRMHEDVVIRMDQLERDAPPPAGREEPR